MTVFDNWARVWKFKIAAIICDMFGLWYVGLEDERQVVERRSAAMGTGMAVAVSARMSVTVQMWEVCWLRVVV